MFMSNEKKTKTPSSKEEKKQKTGYISWWLFRTKGTIAEDWPTAEELRNNEDVQNEIKAVRQAFQHTRTKQKKNN